ncbi:MAG TPA: two-component regulator propeller domain-containing protein [Usitatibacteraceae bacterium]|nr:two-component regulator propeller domain-containing protein [Usitatibacteraceae bacterium]
MTVLRRRLARACALSCLAAFACAAGAASDAKTAAPAAGGPSATGTAAAPKGQEFTHFRVGSKNVKTLYAEGDVLWVGTSGGVIRYDTKKEDFKLFDVKSGLLSNGIFHVSRFQGRMAFGTYGGGLSLLDEKTGKWENFNVPEGLGDAFVYDMLQASNGDLWIATWSGVNRVRGGALRDRSKWSLHTVESTKGGLINDWVYALAEGKDGIIWMATEGGLVRFQDGKWDNWNHARGLGADYEKVKNDIAYRSDPSKVSQHHAKQKMEMGLEDVDVAYNPNYIVAMAVDRQGVVWCGTWGGGLSRFDGKSWKTWTTAEGLPGNHVSLLHVDRSGVLWVGTNNGLAQMKDGRFKVMTVKDGLFANTVFSMVTTAAGGIWVGSFGGVAHIRRPHLH